MRGRRRSWRAYRYRLRMRDDLFEFAELRELRDKLSAVGRIQRILILNLRHQKIQEYALAGRLCSADELERPMWMRLSDSSLDEVLRGLTDEAMNVSCR